MQKQIKMLVGSHNFGINDAHSDKDYVVFVTPEKEDLYRGTRTNFTKKENGIEIQYLDYRYFVGSIFKPNFGVFLTLFSKDIESLKYPDSRSFEKWIEKREEMAFSGRGKIYSSAKGVFIDNMKKLDSYTKTSEWRKDAFGYNTKTAGYAMLALRVLSRYIDNNFKSFYDAIHLDKKTASEIIAIKNGKYTKEDFIEFAYKEYDAFKNKYDESMKKIKAPNLADLQASLDKDFINLIF